MELNTIKVDHIFLIICTELLFGGSGSGKINLLLNLIEKQPDIDKIYCMLKIRMK